jgi:hypothetical protein
MIWWLRTHRALWLAGVAMASAAASSLLGAIGFLFPALQCSGPFGAVPLFAVLPLAVSIALSTFLAEADQPVYRTAARPRLTYDWLLPATTVAIVVAVAVASLVVSAHGPLETIRNIIGFIGLQWIAGSFVTYRYQAAVPVLYVFVSAVFGRISGDRSAVATWAWPLSPNTEPSFWILPIIFFIAGSVTTLVRGPALPRGH